MIRSNSVHLLRDYALTGWWCGVPAHAGGERGAVGRLARPILTDYTLSPLSFAAVYPATQRQALKVKRWSSFWPNTWAPSPRGTGRSSSVVG